MSKKNKAARKPKDARAREIADLEGKLADAIRKRDEKREALNAKRAKLIAMSEKAMGPYNTAVHRIEAELKAAIASQRAEMEAEGRQAGRMLPPAVRLIRDAVDLVPGAVDTDGTGKVVKAPTVIRVRDTLSQMRSLTPAEIAIAREFQALFRQCSYGDLKAANMERVGAGGARPAVIDFVEDRRAEMNRLFRLVGGMYSPMGSILYHVLGMEETIESWCARQASDGKRVWSEQRASGALAAAIAHLNVIWSFRHIVVIEDAVRGQLLKTGYRQGVPA